MLEEYSQLLMYQEGVPQCTSPQWNIMKQFSGIITSIAEPWWTIESIEWRWEQLKIFNLIGLLKALITLNLPWKLLILLELFSLLLFLGTIIWFDKSYTLVVSSLRYLHQDS